MGVGGATGATRFRAETKSRLGSASEVARVRACGGARRPVAPPRSPCATRRRGCRAVRRGTAPWGPCAGLRVWCLVWAPPVGPAPPSSVPCDPYVLWYRQRAAPASAPVERPDREYTRARGEQRAGEPSRRYHLPTPPLVLPCVPLVAGGGGVWQPEPDAAAYFFGLKSRAAELMQ